MSYSINLMAFVILCSIGISQNCSFPLSFSVTVQQVVDLTSPGEGKGGQESGFDTAKVGTGYDVAKVGTAGKSSQPVIDGATNVSKPQRVVKKSGPSSRTGRSKTVDSDG